MPSGNRPEEFVPVSVILDRYKSIEAEEAGERGHDRFPGFKIVSDRLRAELVETTCKLEFSSFGFNSFLVKKFEREA